MTKTLTHEPVMVNEVIENLHLNNQARIIDATLGTGGYSLELLKKGARVLGIDADPKMLGIAKERLFKAYPESFCILVNGNFKDIARIARENGFANVDGVVFDLGISNIHFLGDNRGFSFGDKEAPLDMRLNPGVQAVKASDLLNTLREDQLISMLGHGLAKKIVEARKTKLFEKVGDLTELIGEKRFGRTHPATKAFLALRVAVNSELENLTEGLSGAYEVLKNGGRLVVITFNSDEQKIVSRFRQGRVLTKKPVPPSREEVERNPKSRSALLNVIEKT